MLKTIRDIIIGTLVFTGGLIMIALVLAFQVVLVALPFILVLWAAHYLFF